MSDTNKTMLKIAKIKASLSEAGFVVGTDNDFYFGTNNYFYTSLPSGPGVSLGFTTGDDFIVDGTGTGRSLQAGQGNDVIVGGSGGDSISGGTGTDTAAYVTATSGVTLYMTANQSFSSQFNRGDARGDVLSSIENVVGSRYDDYIVGTGVNNAIWGWDGHDTLIGGTGIDQLRGGAGYDRLFAEDGYSGAPGIPTSTTREQLFGEAGNDTLFAGRNRDRLDGGSEELTTIGNGELEFAGDIVSYRLSDAAVTINLATGVASGGYATGDLLVEIEAVSGSAYGDTLTGNGERNILEGGEGNDRLRGGGNSDIFYYDFTDAAWESGPANLGDDVIEDFQIGTDFLYFFGQGEVDLTFTQDGADTVVTFAGFEGSVRLLNVDASAFIV
jgi:Ca2+-binding RTX toxin-like protein